ncbi:hypothetical protein ACM55G_11480 [Flavobacterium sp. LB3P122]|uniref:hypothetical protein n=1 Tax=Flavobacterium algoriphilum TaxID=3398738 RepID=UPI003A8A883E
MKSLLIILMFLGLCSPSYSQDQKKDTVQGKMKITELPPVVIKKAGKDFAVYLPDNNPDKGVQAVEEKFIGYDLGKDYEGFEEYLVVLSTAKGTLSATYNENGKLMRVVEEYKNVKLPSEVIYSIYRAYPGWAIVNDQFLYTQSKGDVVKKQYNVKIKKNKEVVKLVVRPDGEIIKMK